MSVTIKDVTKLTSLETIWRSIFESTLESSHSSAKSASSSLYLSQIRWSTTETFTQITLSTRKPSVSVECNILKKTSKKSLTFKSKTDQKLSTSSGRTRSSRSRSLLKDSSKTAMKTMTQCLQKTENPSGSYCLIKLLKNIIIDLIYWFS